jgi:hypothetical protein
VSMQLVYLGSKSLKMPMTVLNGHPINSTVAVLVGHSRSQQRLLLGKSIPHTNTRADN